MITVNIHASLQRFCDGKSAVLFEKSSDLTSLLKQLINKYPRLDIIIFNKNKDAINPFIIIYVDGKDSRHLEATTPIADKATIDIITALVGG